MTEKAQPGNVFLRSQARILLKQRYILFLGDSVQRGMYKDLVALVHDGHLMGDAEKRAKGEQCYRGDYCLNISELTNQTNFTEVREYRGYAPLTHEERTLFGQRNWNWSNSILIRFGFITRGSGCLFSALDLKEKNLYWGEKMKIFKKKIFFNFCFFIV
ncbi:unnamed protein product [Oikopleura dioica]|uniref:Uncharacterized protein n=1 Tax=Oikopleura dioica TaxID=34765 RepID=E4Y871_OIKDI|nr:unnamed protein product [Oikopleura dioica]